jgi:hypothetical protein
MIYLALKKRFTNYLNTQSLIKQTIMKKAFMPLLGIVLLVSCKSSDSKIDTMADRACDCFGLVTKDMSADTKAMLVKVSTNADPQTALKDDLMALPDDKKMAVANDLMKMAQLQDDKSEVGKCVKKMDEEYKVMNTEKKEAMQRMITQMESKKGCEVSAAIAKIGLNQQIKSGAF